MLDLKQPLDDLFYQVYNSTLNRDLPYFADLKVKSRSLQAQKLAKQLGGQFRREKLHPKGVLCELSWPVLKKTAKLPQWLKFVQYKLNFEK